MCGLIREETRYLLGRTVFFLLTDEVTLTKQWPRRDHLDKNIVDRYRFVKEPKIDLWITQPNFEGDLGDDGLISAAERVKQFFYRNNNWETTKNNPKFRTKLSCTNLLYITAARYLLVTHILYVQSGKNLIPCSTTSDKKTAIPDSGVCFLNPYGPLAHRIMTSDSLERMLGILPRSLIASHLRTIPAGSG